jgi:hypothetical protein
MLGAPARREEARHPKGRTLAEVPALARSWHPLLNGALRARDVAVWSAKRIWWRCAKASDHVWQTFARSRAQGQGCPFCAGKRASIASCLAVRAPAVAAEWHPTRNDGLTTRDVTIGTPRVVWWKCAKGADHVWRASVHERATRGKRCPFCAGLRVSATNCLARARPDIAATWHPTKNGRPSPRDVLPGSSRMAWWLCPRAPDHVWRGPIASRARFGCRYCTGRAVCRSNSLAGMAPKVVAQWHPTKNGRLRPVDVYYRSAKPVWWKCNAAPDHEWRTAVVNRVRMGPGCPFCSGKWLSASMTLAARFPKLAAEWHPTKNWGLRPTDIHFGSVKMIWWKCAAGPDHEWRARCGMRTSMSTLCPFCIGRRLSITNSLAAKYPQVAVRWHPTRNGRLKPTHVLPGGGGKMYWWRCDKGHEYRRTTSAERKARGCSLCRTLRRKPRAATTWKRRERILLPSDFS